MSIASAITAAQGKVADCYTAISNKGGTLPATQNLSNMPTAISSIPSGGGSTKYGASVDTLLGDVNANGVLQGPTEQSDLVFTGVKDVVNYGLYYKFTRTNVKSISFPDLTTISGIYGCADVFYECSTLTSVSLPNLTTVSGMFGCNYMFYGCPLTSVYLPNLTTISGMYGCYYMFSSCYSLTSVSIPNLTTISEQFGAGGMFASCIALTSVSFPSVVNIGGAAAFFSAFVSCVKLESIYFNALTTTSFGSNINQFNNMFNTGSGSTSGAITMHFPSNLSSTISTLTGYPNFGATAGRLTLAFDLPATS